MSVPPRQSGASTSKPSVSRTNFKSSSSSSKPPAQTPRPLSRLFNVDTSRALNVSLPTRYDPYYRFPGKPPVYAPYNSEILEEMARHGVLDHSLALSEDSRCWRLYELLQDENLMREFMKKPKGWVVRLGPRGTYVSFAVHME